MRVQGVVRSILAGFVVSCGLGSTAWADDRIFHGSVCNPRLESLDKIDYTHNGAYNASAHPAYVSCGASVKFHFDETIKDIWLHVYDRHETENVGCAVVLVDYFGNIVKRVTNSTSGWSPNGIFLGFILNQKASSFYIECYLPGRTNHGFSHLTTFRLITTLP